MGQANFNLIVYDYELIKRLVLKSAYLIAMDFYCEGLEATQSNISSSSF
jgi:hypothetical protein